MDNYLYVTFIHLYTEPSEVYPKYVSSDVEHGMWPGEHPLNGCSPSRGNTTECVAKECVAKNGVAKEETSSGILTSTDAYFGTC